MRIQELILETTEEDRGISKLAAQLRKRVIAFVDAKPRGGIIGKLAEFVKGTTLESMAGVTLQVLPNSMLHKAFGDPEIDPKLGRIHGFWDPNRDRIVLNLRHVRALSLSKTIAHELRHALDDIKSDYRASDPDNRYGKHPEGSLFQPDEINARYAESMHIAILKIGKLAREGWTRAELMAELPEIIKFAFKANLITHVMPERYSDRAYRHLASRAYRLLSAEVNKLLPDG